MDDEPENTYRNSPPKLSKAPSWVTLGFIFGALFVWALPRQEKKSAMGPTTATETVASAPSAPPKLTTIEAVFAEWGRLAVWSAETTEVALWDGASGSYSEFYEGKRSGGALYFRSIPRLTRPVIRHGTPPPPECPLQFTETAEQYREWLQNGRVERPVEESTRKFSMEQGSASATGVRTSPSPPPAVVPIPLPPLEKPAIELSPKR